VTDEAWAKNAIKDVLLSNLNEQRRKRRWGIFFRVLFFGYIFFLTFIYFQGQHKVSKTSTPKKEHVAQVDLLGSIMFGQLASAENLNYALDAAFSAPNAKGLIIRINSSGGSPVQSKIIYDKITSLKAKYPKVSVYAVIEDIGTSAAYHVACAADYIYASEASLVGSIGVMLDSFGFVDALDKLGVERRLFTAGTNKAFLDPFKPIDREQKEYINSQLKAVHKSFIRDVKAGRGNKLQDDGDIYSGLFWVGSRAKELGLIDAIGDTELVRKKVIGVDSVINYSRNKTFIELFTDRIANFVHRIVTSFKLAQLMA